MGSGPQTPSPQVVPGFEGIGGAANNLAGIANGQNIFAQQIGIDPNVLQQGQQQLLAQLGLGAPTRNAFLEGLNTGFAPDVLQSVQAGLQPALERASDRGAAAIREQAAGAGTLTGTGTTQQFADFRGGLDSSVLQQLAGIQGQGALQGQNIRGQLAQNQPVGGALASILPFISEQLGQSRFNASQPLNAAGAAAGLLNGLPLFQPTTEASKSSNVLGTALPIAGTVAGGAFGGPGGAKLGNMAGSAVAGDVTDGGTAGGGGGKAG